MGDFEVQGADQFLRLSKALKAAGRGDLRKELNAGLRRAAKPLIADTRAEALRILPQRGGFAQQVARQPQRIQVRTGMQTAGVRVVAPRGLGAAANRGYIRHPVFGNRRLWVEQKVPAGWFDRPIRRGARKVRRDLARSIEDMGDRVISDAVSNARKGR